MFNANLKDREHIYIILFISIYVLCVASSVAYLQLDFKAILFLLTNLIFYLILLAFIINKIKSTQLLKLKNDLNGVIQQKEIIKAKLEHLEKKWENLTDILSITMLSINDKGIVLKLINNLFVNNLSEGSNIYEMFPAENLPQMRKAISKTFSQSLITRFTLKTIKSVDNHIVWYDAIVSPIKSYDNVISADIIFIDSTKHKIAQSEKERLIIQLEKQKKELEQFSLSITHDLKSPLITINGFVGMLRKDLLTNNQNQIEKDIFHITNATNRMESLLDDLIKISQIGKLDYKYMPTPLGDIASDAINLVSGRIKDKNVKVKIINDLPVLAIDRRRITEVFINLLDNAIKYMGNQPNPLIEIGSKKKCGETICFVKDNGMGIDYRHQDRIFSLFDKLDHQSEGTGLGLAVVRRIIDKHNGLIWVESEGKGKGSTFCFIIPEKKLTI